MNLKTILTVGSFLVALLLLQDSYGDVPSNWKIIPGCFDDDDFHAYIFKEHPHASSMEMCMELCEQTTALHCRSVHFSMNYEQCGMSENTSKTIQLINPCGHEEVYAEIVPADPVEYSPPVTCRSNEVSVSLDMTKFNGVVWSSVSVNGQTESVCKAQVDVAIQSARFTFPLGSCNSSIEAQPTKNILTYSNVIETTVDSGQIGNVTRGSNYEIHFACTYNITRGLEAVFLGNVSKTVYSGIGNGEFEVRQDLYHDSAFQLSIRPTDSIHVSERVYASVALISDVADLTMRVVSCIAYPTKGAGHQHSMIENRCLNDPTTEFVNETSSEYRYSFQSFKFMQYTSDVLIRCSVVVCPKNENCGANPTNQCGRRKKRNVESDNRELQLVIGGPLHLVGQRLHSPLQKLFHAKRKMGNE